MITPLRLATLLVLLTAAWLGIFRSYIFPELADLVQETTCGAPGQACPLMDRNYNALIPTGDGPFPVVVFFHGSALTGKDIITREHLVRPFIERGYAFVAPTAGLVRYGDGGMRTGWRHDGTNGNNNDYAFIQALLNDVTDRFPLDDARILIAGHSNGGIFSWYLACADIDPRLTAFAPASGTPIVRYPGNCQTDVPDYHLMHTHGLSDPVVPFEGLPRQNGYQGFVSTEEATSTLAQRAGCVGAIKTSAGSFQATNWQSCREGLYIGFATYDGGHSITRAWPDYILDWYEALPAGNF
ncbi:alpha/beta hydrolase family esterase [Halocynthiibacter styelae]|uniref:Polyhydroxybutyrate depolymerase n=1 Tax=Halocynthiibacter styelae TaxID=2761955 RepID=A0A8J7IQ15_9RHOB|nr:hypothetical protein [Paenihalocynthiibacter styelae]MBI1493146.1 hypothetical protein [Paenihalocynthiibacter styelae]